MTQESSSPWEGWARPPHPDASGVGPGRAGLLQKQVDWGGGPVYVQISGTCACDFIWKSSLCKCSYVEDLETTLDSLGRGLGSTRMNVLKRGVR